MLKRNYRMLAILLAIALLLACAPIAVATPPAPPTFDLLSLNTIIAQTAGAAATQTFVLQPTLTPYADHHQNADGNPNFHAHLSVCSFHTHCAIVHSNTGNFLQPICLPRCIAKPGE